MNKVFCYLTFLLFVFISCNKGSTEQIQDLEKLKSMKKSFYENVEKFDYDFNKAAELADAYKVYIEKYPKDTLVPHLVFELANLNLNFLGYATDAINLYLAVYEKYPKHEHAPVSLFMIANTYHDKLEKFGQAKTYFDKLIEEYPSHPLAEQALVLRDNIGKNDEELLQSILDKKAREETFVKK
jgi:tetratricopeptide (TPR) repeat protein